MCRKCDVFVGMGAAGVVEVPHITVAMARPEAIAWLQTHCWMCHRSIDEVEADPWGRA